MSAIYNFISIDLGASNGRVVIGRLADKKLELEVVHRFFHRVKLLSDRLYWDWDGICENIRDGLARAVEILRDEQPVSISCDAWAQDFGILGNDGKVLYPPLSYRDSSFRTFHPNFFKRIDRRSLIARTGGVVLPITTLAQLFRMSQDEPEKFRHSAGILNIADMVHHSLCGKAATDITLATASQLSNITTNQWDTELLEAVGIPSNILPPIADAPTILGKIKADNAPHPKLAGVPVVISAGHDTAAASFAAGPLDEHSLFLSEGTYAMLGCISEKSAISAKTADSGCACSELARRQWGLFASITGLWLFQECCKQWEQNGWPVSYDTLAKDAMISRYRGRIPLSSAGVDFSGDACGRLVDACANAGLKPPADKSEFARLIFESMAEEHAAAAQTLAKLTGHDFRNIRMVSGGSRNTCLCQLLANALELPLAAGPAEASTIGNIMLQARAMGVVTSDNDAFDIIKNSFPSIIYNVERPFNHELPR
ncbi:MAG TPA: FGGY family carbohydrate kinase [Phycisphaerae bacterium]|nr:FGGY family carbohydrate kinase [Phycisphaerae bacterium]